MTVYRSSEFKEGVESLFSFLDYMEHTLSASKEVDQFFFPENKIVGGKEAYKGSFPFIASLKIKGWNRY